MLNTVFGFEIRQQVRKPFTWIFALLMFAQGLYYMHHGGEFYSADQTYANAPAIMYTVLAGIGYISFILTAMLGGGALAKDLEHRTAAPLYTTGVKEPTFFWGRFSGGLAVLLLFNVAYLLGIVLYSFLPIPNLGPLSIAALGRAVLLILLPNTFVLYCMCFAVTVFSGNGKTAYAVVLTAMLFMIFGVSMYEINRSVVIIDPTSFAILADQLDHLSPAEKNSYAPDFSGALFLNRLLWVAVALVSLGLAYRRYSFKRFGLRMERKVKKMIRDPESVLAVQPVAADRPLSVANRRFSVVEDIRKVFALAGLEFRSVIRPFGFKIFLMILLIFYVCYIAIWQQQYYSAAPTLPVTLEVTGVTLPLSFYFLMFIVINTTELLFKDRATGFWTIADALPLGSWVSVLSKVLAMIGVGILLSAFLLLFGVVVQTAKGYYHYELGIYFNDLFVRWIPKYTVYILLTVFFAGLTANRYTTHACTIVFLVISIVLHELEVIEQHRLNFVFSPGSGMYTDMNGNGIFTPAHNRYMLYWFALSLALGCIGLWLWQRGIPRGFAARLRNRPGWILAGLFAVSLAVFSVTGRDIYDTVNVRNRFQNEDEEQAEQALYEKTYKRYQSYPQPLITHLDLRVDFYPARRKLDYTARLSMENTSQRTIDTLHLEWMDFSVIDRLDVEGFRLKLVHDDEELRHRIYVLDHPVLPGDSITALIEGTLAHEGYTNDDPQKELTYNGSFLPDHIVPYFGYDEERELKTNSDRREAGLVPLPRRLAVSPDSLAAHSSFASTQAAKLSWDMRISTTGDQDIVAPGRCVNTWQENGRRHYRFVSEKPDVFDFHILSATYTVVKEHVVVGGRGVDVEVYHHPGHSYNAAHMMESAKEALTFLAGKLGPYPYATLRIAERPRYDEDLFAYGNVAVLPENHGWIGDIRRKEDLDYLRYITADLIAQQYMRQSNLARIAGYPLITRSIPGYLAYLQLRQFYGDGSLAGRLKKSRDHYLKGRASEPNIEPSLLQVDDEATYVSEQKGSYVLYRLGSIIGHEGVESAISAFYSSATEKGGGQVDVNDFYNLLKKNTPADQQQLLTDYFEKITPLEFSDKD